MLASASKRAPTDHGAVAVREACDEAVSVGLHGCVDDLGVRGLGFPKADVVHDGRAKQDGLLRRCTIENRQFVDLQNWP